MEQRIYEDFMIKRLKANDPTLTLLSIIGKNMDDSCAKRLASAMEKNHHLTSLYIGENNIGDNGAKAFAQILKNNRVLVSLDMEDNGITEIGIRALFISCKENLSLTELNLASNNIGDEGVKIIAGLLKYDIPLNFLNLGGRGNNISAVGAKAFAESLNDNYSLTYIDLEKNKIGDDGAKEFALAFKNNRSLTSCDLRGNNIGDEGAQALIMALKDNHSLTELILSHNNITTEGVKKMDVALKGNRSLTELMLSNNKIVGNAGMEAQKNIDLLMQVNEKFRDAFLGAAGNGNLDVVKKFLEQGVSIHVNARANKLTALHVSSKNGHLAVVKFLVEQGANVTLKTEGLKTALDLAKANNHREVVNYLEKSRVVPKKAVPVNTTALKEELIQTKARTKELEALVETQTQQIKEYLAQLQQTRNEVDTLKTQNKSQEKQLFQEKTNFEKALSDERANMVQLKEALSLKKAELIQQHELLAKYEKNLKEFDERYTIQEISIEELTFEKELGEGNFAKAYAGQWHTLAVAIKKPKAQNISQEEADNFKKEMLLLGSFHSPYIVRLYGGNTGALPLMVMEHCVGGSLDKRLLQGDFIDWGQREKWAYEIAAGLAYLHAKNVLHCDIACRNVLLDKEGTAKLADFGLSKIKRYDNRNRTLIASVEYTEGDIAVWWAAPEFLEGNQKNIFTFKTDIFSYGILLWEMASHGQPPLLLIRQRFFQLFHQMQPPPSEEEKAAKTMEILIQEVVHKEYRDPVPGGTPRVFGQIMAECRDARPERRPEAAGVIRHFRQNSATFFQSEALQRQHYVQMNLATNPAENVAGPLAQPRNN